MKNDGFKYKRKKVIVFSYEGKTNKTESIYFSHFVPCDDNCVIKHFSSGVTDPVKMVESTKSKRKIFDYNAREDRTYIFIDGDNNKDKIKIINELIAKQPRDIKIILSNPCFEIWFLNHFVKTTKSFHNGKELIEELDKHIVGYNKNKDYYYQLNEKRDAALKNSKYQLVHGTGNPLTNVGELIEKGIIKDKDN